MKPSECVNITAGFDYVVTTTPFREPKILGNPPSAVNRLALLCDGVGVEGRPDGIYIAAVSDEWSDGLAYELAHEIAESRYGHEHTIHLYDAQCSILSDWLSHIARSP